MSAHSTNGSDRAIQGSKLPQETRQSEGGRINRTHGNKLVDGMKSLSVRGDENLPPNKPVLSGGLPSKSHVSTNPSLLKTPSTVQNSTRNAATLGQTPPSTVKCNPRITTMLAG